MNKMGEKQVAVKMDKGVKGKLISFIAFIQKKFCLPLFIVFLFVSLLNVIATFNFAEACTRKAPSVLFSPTSGVIGASSSKEYKITITNNDVEDGGPACGTSTFTLGIPVVGGETGNTASFALPSILGSVSTDALAVGARYNTTLTVTTAGSITEDHKLTTIVQATEAAHATGKGSVVTKASSSKGDGNLLKRAEEETCHACHKTDRNRTPSDADWADAIKSHSSTTLSSGKWSASGGWGVAGGKYGEFVCTTCHTGHSTTNIYLIKETITTPDGSNFGGSGTNSVTVDFRYKTTQPAGTPGTFGDDTDTVGHASSSRICEVCHTYDSGQTTGVNKHAYNMSAASPQNPGHYNSEGCTTCHDHKKSFSGAGGTCNSCHGAPVGSGSDNNAPAQYKASHEKHYNPAAGVPTSYTDASIASTTTTYVFKCGRCHSDNSANHTANSDGTVDVLLPLGGTFSPGSYAGGDNPPPPGSVTFKNSNATCSSLYCHSDGITPYTAVTNPVWGDSTTGECGDCHNATAANPPTRGSHSKHVSSSYYSLGCQLCHNATTTDGTSIADKTLHVNEKSNWNISTSDSRTNGGTYNGQASGNKTPSTTYYTCNNLYCHSTGASNNSPYPAPNITPTWGGSLDATCTGCHNGYSGATSKMSTGTHTAHINNASIIGSNYSCQICHSATASGNTAIWQYSSHTDKYVDVDFTALNPSGVYDGTAIPGDAYDTCSTIYCHSNGKVDGTAGAYVTPTWGGAAIGCNGCHGVGTTAGTPNYANGGAGSDGANSHSKHTGAGTSTCVYCHTNTTTTGTTITGTEHINNTRNVSAGGGKNFSYAGQTCSTISCHYDGTATWGATLNCSSCHAFPPATNAHAAHIQNSALLTTAYGNTEVASNGTNYAFGCGNCHPINQNTYHANGAVDISLNPADGGALKSMNAGGAGRSGSGGTTVCTGVYCHSNGAGGAASNLAAATSPAWNTPFTGNKCGYCHGNPPQYASVGSGVAGANSHYNASNFMGKEGGHMLTIHRDNIYDRVTGNDRLPVGTTTDSSHGNSTVATTMSCNVCHSGIISSTTVDTYAMDGTTSSFKCSTCHTGATTTKLQAGAIADKSLHVNGSANVVFAAITMKSKAQLRDASKPATWTRNGTYGVSGSYDSAALNGTWNAGPRTCTTACHDGGSATWGDTTVTCYSCHTSL